MGAFQRYLGLRRLIGPVSLFLLGAALLGAHLWLLPRLLQASTRSDLVVTITPGQAGGDLFGFEAQLPADLAGRTALLIDGLPREALLSPPGPGLHRVEWGLSYRGGFSRRVGLSRVVGPFQDPQRPPCGAHLYLSQSLLDDGEAGPGTLAGVLRRTIESEMEGLEVVVLGKFKHISHIEIWWGKTGFLLFGGMALRIKMTIEFEDGDVPIDFVLTPRLKDGRFTLSREARAEVKGEGWIEKAASYVADGDGRATEIAQQQIDATGSFLEEILRVPPPFPLGEGRSIQFAYCQDEEIQITERGFAVIPLAILPWPGEAGIAPVALPSREETPPPPDAPIALDLDLNAVNGILHYLWASGYLDEELAKAEDWFHSEEAVRRFLTLRLASLRFSLPPTIELRAGEGAPFQLGLEAALLLEDRGEETDARLFGRMGLDLFTPAPSRVGVDLSIEDLVLTCTPKEGVLVPCYADIFEELRRRAPDLQRPLGELLGEYLSALLGSLRLSEEGVPLQLIPSSSRVSAQRSGEAGWVRVELFGALQGAR